MQIIICYNSNEVSNSIASSTVHYFSENPVENLTVDRINIDKINIIKHIKTKCTSNPILYIHNKFYNKDLIYKIKKEMPEISVILYDNSVVYRPARVPGNKLKTVVYLLKDAIMLDLENDFKTHKVYKVYIRDKEIEITEKSSFDMFHPKGRGIDCYFTKKEAIKRIETSMEKEELYSLHQVELKRAKLEKEKEDLDSLRKRNKEILTALLKDI